MVHIAYAQGVGLLVPLGIEVACRLLLAHAQHKLVYHIELHLLRCVQLILNSDLVVFLHAVDRHEKAHVDLEVVVVGIECRPALAVTGCGGEELPFVHQQHLAGSVAHDVVAPTSKFELLGVVGEGEAGHRRAYDAAEVALVGQDINPRHRRVGVGDDIVATTFVKSTILVVVVERAPHTEVHAGLEQGVFHFVLVQLVVGFQTFQLLLDGESFFAVEAEPCDGVQQGALVGVDVAAVEDEHLAVGLVRSPEMLGVGHIADEMGEAVVLFTLSVIDNDQVENHSMHLVVFEGPQHLFGEARLGHAVYFHQHDGVVATDAEAPQVAL